jgi:hypothetical protein
VRTVRKKLDLAEIRRTAIAALFPDDVLTDYLVLKGGNALDLVYGITHFGRVVF